MGISGYYAGAASDFLIRTGHSVTSVRKIMQSIGFMGPGLSLLCLNYAKSPSCAAVFMTIALSLSSFSQAGFLLNMQDIAPQYAGFLHGISNCAGTLAAIVSTIEAGYFVHGGLQRENPQKMDEIADQTFFRYCLLTLIFSGPPTAFALKFLQAPYGKHNRSGWGPTISPPLAWFVMESPTLWLSLLLFPFGRHSLNPKSLLLISPYLLHYFHRTIIYPLRLLRSSSASNNGFPVSVAAMAFIFNLLNAYIQARWVSHYKSDYEDGQRFWWRFVIGMVVFVTGLWINITSDRTLVRLKKENRGGYVIPRGGWFELVSCPNYFGEVLEWLGWAVMTWSWAGFGFFLYTCSNLIPRARASHRWYNDKFKEEYPNTRKAVIPFVY